MNQKFSVLIKGKIVKTGGPELALELEERGYEWLDNDDDNADSEESKSTIKTTD